MPSVLSIAPPQQQPQIWEGDGFRTNSVAFDWVRGSLRGCWHRRMSWPITRDRRTYRVCLNCGMCRSFDPKSWKTFGPYFRRD